MGSKRQSVVQGDELLDLITTLANAHVEIAQLKGALRRIGVRLPFARELDVEDLEAAVEEYLA